MPRTLRAPLALLALLLAAAGCDSTETPAAGGTYVGTFVGSQSGALSITVDGSTATASMAVQAARLATQPALTGSFDAATGRLTLSGGGYTFTGTLSGTTLSGTWTGPGGASGAYTTSLSGTGADAVAVYCGGYSGTDDDNQPVSGTLNIVTRGTGLTGYAASSGGSATGLSGSVAGRDVSVWVTSDPARTVVATGTISADGGSLTGTFRGASDQGTWSASRCTP